MVSSAHEGMHRIFQERPELLSPVFRVLGVPFPEKATVDALVADVTETRPVERRVDTVLRVGPSDGDDFLLAIEAQGKRDGKKASSWAYYVAHLQAKYELPVLLLVVCQDRATAKWATGPFECGTRGWTAQRTYPLVVGPDNLPVITDARTAEENLALASFAALTHARSPHIGAILDALGRALQASDHEASGYFVEFLEIGLGGTPAGDRWKEIMSVVTYFPGRGTLIEKAYLKSKAEGKAEAVLQVLEARGLPVSEQVRERVTECSDLSCLNDWLGRALAVTRAEDLFAEAEQPLGDVPESPSGGGGES